MLCFFYVFLKGVGSEEGWGSNCRGGEWFVY